MSDAPLLLLFTLRNVGHFTVYCHNLTLWALSRGWEVAYCGLDAEGTAYHVRFRDHPQVRFLDARGPLGLGNEPLDDAAVLERLCRAEGGAERQAAALRQVQRELAPTATVLLQADEFLFNHPLERSGPDLFAAPTWGVLTFGHRDRYTACDEKYAWRLRRVLRDRGPFAGLLTIDEYHAAAVDPDQRYLVHLPDPYRPVREEGEAGAGEPGLPDAALLRRFLDSDPRPVLPVAGKFDARKNNLWLLEEVLARPGLRCAVLGERAPGPEQDGRIDALLAELEGQGRLFCRFGFAPHGLFDILFSSPRVEFAAFPYLAHYGSSGIQLMAAEHGKPSLVPDNGLMGRRVRDAGLGLLFRHGDREDFRRQFGRLQAGEARGDAADHAAFAAAFGRESRFAALDHAFGGQAAPPPLPAWTRPRPGGGAGEYLDLANQALDLAHRGETAAGLARLDAALALAPGHGSLLLRRFALLLRSGDAAACRAAWNRALDAGGIADETGFLVQRLMEYLRDLPPGQGVYDEGLLLGLLRHLALGPEELRGLGGLLAARGAYPEAEAAFVRALAADPGRGDIRLNLSDVLRFAGRLAASHAALDELARRSPDAPGLWCKRGQVLAAEGRTDEARAALEREIAAGGPFADLAASWLDRLA